MMSEAWTGKMILRRTRPSCLALLLLLRLVLGRAAVAQQVVVVGPMAQVAPRPPPRGRLVGLAPARRARWSAGTKGPVD
jgi:hypothetical protein